MLTAELLECDAEGIQVAHTSKEALWLVKAPRTVTESVQAVSRFGTADCHAIDLLNDALNLRVPMRMFWRARPGQDKREQKAAAFKKRKEHQYRR